MNDARQLTKAILALGGFLLFLAITMFVPAGIGWWNGWVLLLVFLIQMAIAVLYLWRRNPDIFVARSKIQAGTKGWDKVLLLFLLSSFWAIFVVTGFEHGLSLWAIGVGYILLTIGMAGSVWVYGVNKFAEPGVRIQTERGHKVVDSGPYAIVRHPLYAASFFLVVGIALALGSFWALIPVALGSLVLIVRTVLEDRTLQEELPGYKDYAGRVRYRLVPGVW